MKKGKLTLLFSLIILISVASFFKPASDKYPASLPVEAIDFFESEYLSTMNSESLISDLENKFSPLFDEVHSVDAQFNKDQGYYYLVFGVKDNIEKVEMLKVEESDIVDGTYTYINFSGISAMSDVDYCASGSGIYPFVCPPGCIYVPGCLGVICGIRVNGTNYCDIE